MTERTGAAISRGDLGAVETAQQARGSAAAGGRNREVSPATAWRPRSSPVRPGSHRPRLHRPRTHRRCRPRAPAGSAAGPRIVAAPGPGWRSPPSAASVTAVPSAATRKRPPNRPRSVWTSGAFECADRRPPLQLDTEVFGPPHQCSLEHRSPDAEPRAGREPGLSLEIAVEVADAAKDPPSSSRE